MSRVYLLFLLSFIGFANAWGSAEVCIDHEKNEVEVRAHYFFYGAQAWHKYAKPCISEINQLFNDEERLIQLNKIGPWLKLKFNVTYSIMKEKNDEAAILQKIYLNTNPRFNYARIDLPPTESPIEISEHALKGNTGYFDIRNGLGTSTTCAHEFAHGLGLDHPKTCDFRGKGVPPIMAHRGCLVDAKYQYNPNAGAGDPGGTINPIHRRLSNNEFQQLKLGDLNFRYRTPSLECAKLGRAGNTMYDDRSEAVKANFMDLL